MKDAYYFSHDANARHDPKLVSFGSKYGVKGYAYFFMLIELLREQDGYKLPINLKPSIAMLWRCYGDAISNDEFEVILKDIQEFGLVNCDGEYIYSESLCQRMTKMDEARAKFSKAGSIGATTRWHRHSDPIALNQTKGKEIKLKEPGQKTGFLSENEKQTVLKDISLKNGVSPSSESATLRLKEIVGEVAAAKNVQNPMGLIRHKARNQ